MLYGPSISSAIYIFLVQVDSCNGYLAFPNLAISSSSHKNKMPEFWHYNTVYFLRYTHPRYSKCLFTNRQKQYVKK